MIKTVENNKIQPRTFLPYIRYKRVPWLFYETNNYYRNNDDILQEEVTQTYTFQNGLDTSKLEIYVSS